MVPFQHTEYNGIRDMIMYRMGGNFRRVLIFVDFEGPMQTTKNSLKISVAIIIFVESIAIV